MKKIHFTTRQLRVAGSCFIFAFFLQGFAFGYGQLYYSSWAMIAMLFTALALTPELIQDLDRIMWGTVYILIAGIGVAIVYRGIHDPMIMLPSRLQFFLGIISAALFKSAISMNYEDKK